MRNLWLVFALVFATYTLKAQDQDRVPQEVCETFNENFPDVAMDDVEWDENDFYYQAEFEEEDQFHEVRIDRSGGLISAEADVSKENIPEEIKQGLNEEFQEEYEINEARMLKTPESTLYKVDVEADGEDHEVYFDKDGNVIKDADKEGEYIEGSKK
ncbi:MAG: PepSY-like domain-containing protein [Cytophagaceae bacterium]